MDVSWGRFGLVFSSIGTVLVGAVLVSVGRFRPLLGPFWSVPVLTGQSTVSSFDLARFSSLSFPTLSCLQSPWCYMYFRDLRSFEIRI